MRITNNYIYNIAENNISEGYEKVADLQAQISTGVRVSEASVDPVEMGDITLLQSKLDSMQQGEKNAGVAQTEIQIEQTQLNSVGTIIQSIVTTVQKAANASSSSDDLKGDAVQLSQYLTELISVANSKNPLGESIFAGTATGKDAYTLSKDSQGDITAVTYQGNDSQQKINLDSGVSVNIYQSGNAIFGSGTNSIFSNLISFVQRLKTGSPLTDQESTAEMTALNGFQEGNTNNLTAVENQYNLADFEVNLYATLKQNYTATLGKERDSDYTKTVTELSKQMTILKAAMSASEEFEKLSIFNQG
jgi:flagellar hook-associated protein 3 FlgL